MEVELKRILLGALLVGVAAHAGAEDFGVAVDALLARNAPALFGIEAPLAHSAAASPMQGYRVAGRSAADSIALADGLVAEFLTTEAASHSDMMAFYPATAPSHLISCIESDAETLEPGKMQPGHTVSEHQEDIQPVLKIGAKICGDNRMDMAGIR